MAKCGVSLWKLLRRDSYGSSNDKSVHDRKVRLCPAMSMEQLSAGQWLGQAGGGAREAWWVRQTKPGDDLDTLLSLRPIAMQVLVEQLFKLTKTGLDTGALNTTRNPCRKWRLKTCRWSFHSCSQQSSDHKWNFETKKKMTLEKSMFYVNLFRKIRRVKFLLIQ